MTNPNLSSFAASTNNNNSNEAAKAMSASTIVVTSSQAAAQAANKSMLSLILSSAVAATSTTTTTTTPSLIHHQTIQLPPLPISLSALNTSNHHTSPPTTTTTVVPLKSTPTPLTQTAVAVNKSQVTSTNGKVVRDVRRRANHNEVERRRRDNINKWIVELSKVIPDCSNDQSKHGQVGRNLIPSLYSF